MNVYEDNPEDVVSAAERNIASNGLIDGVRRLGLAVSGGADSMALLEVMPDICAKAGVTCCAMFVHHGRAGEDEALELVRMNAERRVIPFLSRRCSIEGLVGEGGSIENAAREVRMAALAEMAQSGDLDAVATAHHADDVAETLLLRLMRGSGLSGLAGIRWCSNNGRIRVVRPLLSLTHTALCGFLKGRGVNWVEDPDNADFSSMRVRMRRRVIPGAEEVLGVNIRRALCRSAEFLREEEECASIRTVEELKRVSAGDGVLDGRKLAALPLASRRRVLREWLFANGVQQCAGWQTVSGLLEKIDGGGEWAHTLGRQLRIVSRHGKIRLEFGGDK